MCCKRKTRQIIILSYGNIGTSDIICFTILQSIWIKRPPQSSQSLTLTTRIRTQSPPSSHPYPPHSWIGPTPPRCSCSWPSVAQWAPAPPSRRVGPRWDRSPSSCIDSGKVINRKKHKHTQGEVPELDSNTSPHIHERGTGKMTGKNQAGF